MPDSSASDEPESEDPGLRVTSDPDRIKAKQPDTMGAREISALLFRILNVSNLTRVRALRTGLRATMCISPQSA